MTGGAFVPDLQKRFIILAFGCILSISMCCFVIVGPISKKQKPKMCIEIPKCYMGTLKRDSQARGWQSGRATPRLLEGLGGGADGRQRAQLQRQVLETDGAAAAGRQPRRDLRHGGPGLLLVVAREEDGPVLARGRQAGHRRLAYARVAPGHQRNQARPGRRGWSGRRRSGPAAGPAGGHEASEHGRREAPTGPA